MVSYEALWNLRVPFRVLWSLMEFMQSNGHQWSLTIAYGVLGNHMESYKISKTGAVIFPQPHRLDR